MSISKADYPKFYAASKLVEAEYISAWIIPGSEPEEDHLAIRELACSDAAAILKR